MTHHEAHHERKCHTPSVYLQKKSIHNIMQNKNLNKNQLIRRATIIPLSKLNRAILISFNINLYCPKNSHHLSIKVSLKL